LEVIMNELFTSTIMERFDGLQRDLSRWRWLAATALTCLGLTLLLGATTVDRVEEIRAQRFVLVGQDGKPRVGVGVNPDGIAALRLFDQNGSPRAELSVTADGTSSLSLVEQGGFRVVLGLGPGLVVYDKAGLPRATLGVTPANAPTLTLTDQQGKVIWSAP
jgi:hypothetical protein